MLFFASHFTSPSTLPAFPFLYCFILSLPFLPGARYITKVLYQCFMLEFFLVFILLVGKPCLCWNEKGNGIFDHMCYSQKTVWSNVPKTSKQNLIPEMYALFLMICFVLRLRSKSLVKLYYLPKYNRKLEMHCNIDVLYNERHCQVI